MGKGIDSLKTRKRSEKLAFLEVKTDSTSKYVRLEGFTTQTFTQMQASIADSMWTKTPNGQT